ncbi:MAG TPA: hypothetical protein VN947_20905 [Polyangia bacterium]|nr:hypothetical protein [Polyangia bacterium]
MAKHILAALALVPLVACLSPPVASPRTTVTQETNVRTQQDIKNKVDILFMVDNSSSMDPMQLELRARFGDFLEPFSDLAAKGIYADLHIGVVTSDYGAGDAGGGGCDPSPGGQRGLLQTLPSPNATNPPAGCMAPVGKPYIAYAFGPGAATTNLPNGSDATALVNEFTCMASVGAKGCGFEHQLESVYAALRNHDENADFLRSDALLAVVFVTNEDDGSAAPTAKFYESAVDPMGTSMYGQYSTYRQTRFAVDCGGMPIPYGMPVGPLAGCEATPNPMMDVGHAYDLSRYIRFFTLPSTQGGVKDDPSDVILVGLDGPETPFATILEDPSQTNAPYHACPSPMLSSSCTEALQHSCENTVQLGFFADPAVRLNTVIRSLPSSNSQVSSICGDDPTKTPDYTQTMQAVAELISTFIKPSCLNAPVVTKLDGTPDCVVVDVTKHPDGSAPTQVSVASCAENGNVPPCWQYNDLLPQYQMQGCTPPNVAPPASCMLPASCQPVIDPRDGTSHLASISINRGGMPAPDNTSAHVSCATIASSSQ